MAREAFEEIAETFEFLDDWEDRYRHVIELGRELPPLDDAVKVPATKVEGCASQVCPSVQPVIYLSVCPSVCLAVHPSVPPSVCLSIHTVCLSVHPSIC